MLHDHRCFHHICQHNTAYQNNKMGSAAANFTKKMQALRLEADEHQAKSEELQAKVKALEQENLAKEQEITSLTHRNQLLEGDVEKAETELKEAKEAAGHNAQNNQQTESLQRKLQILEEEAEQADKTLRETNDKYGQHPLRSGDKTLTSGRLRQTDVKAGHYERKVQALEVERDTWETKFEEMSKKYSALQKELQELEVSMGNI